MTRSSNYEEHGVTKPVSAYILFSKQVKDQFTKEELKKKEIRNGKEVCGFAVALSNRWNALSADEKKPFEEEARRQKADAKQRVAKIREKSKLPPGWERIDNSYYANADLKLICGSVVYTWEDGLRHFNDLKEERERKRRRAETSSPSSPSVGTPLHPPDAS